MPSHWTDEDRERLESKVRIAQVVSIMICASIAMYLVVGYVIAAANDPFSGFLPSGESDSVVHILRYVLWALALGVTLPLVLLLRWVLWRQAAAGGAPLAPDRLGDFFLRYSILTCAVAEAPAIYGLVLFLLAGSWVDLIGLGALATVYKSLFIPTVGKAMAWADALENEIEARR